MQLFSKLAQLLLLQVHIAFNTTGLQMQHACVYVL